MQANLNVLRRVEHLVGTEMKSEESGQCFDKYLNIVQYFHYLFYSKYATGPFLSGKGITRSPLFRLLGQFPLSQRVASALADSEFR